MPTDKEWYRRKLIKECKTLKDDRTREINRLHALFVQCGITTIKRSNVQTDVNRQEALPQLFEYEARQAKRVCERLTVLDAQIEELEQLIKQECKEDKCLTAAAEIPSALLNGEFCTKAKHRSIDCTFSVSRKCGHSSILGF